MGWIVGIEPTRAGATIRCVNRFTISTIFSLVPPSDDSLILAWKGGKCQ